MEAVDSMISIEDYISFLLSLLLALGVTFELPLICVTLRKIGILTAQAMIKFRKVVIVIAFVFAAIITPPDVISQFMLAIPIIVLYEISIILCKCIKSRDIEDSEEQ